MDRPDPVFFALLVAGLTLVGVLFRLNCLRDGRVQVNPFLGFLAGVLYYVFTPCIAIGFFRDSIANLTVFETYFTIELAIEVLAFTVVFLAALTLGACLPQHLFRFAGRKRGTMRASGQPVSGPVRSASAGVPWLLFWLSLTALLLLSLSIREFLFAGYDERVLESEAVWAARGAMSSLYSTMVVCAVAVVLWSRGRLSRRRRFAMGLAFLLASVLLLSIGGRLYVAMGLLSMLALVSLMRNGIGIRRFLLSLLLMAGVFAVLGTLRTGSTDSLSSVLLNLALEPLLTSLSLFTLLADNPVIWLGQLQLFPGDFQAVLPSVLFPGKALLFDRLNDYGYEFQAPLGGFHLYFSMLINFGVLGSVALAIPLGFALRRLGNAPALPHMIAPVAAVFLTGAFAFTLFRDPFFIALAKNVFLTGFIVPAVFVTMERLRCLQRALSRGLAFASAR